MSELNAEMIERKKILKSYRDTLKDYNHLMNVEEFEKADGFYKLATQLRDEYFRILPVVPMSCCPFDNKPLLRSFDPYGLDGLWWKSSAEPKEQPTCPHFCLLRGAVNYNGLPPLAGDFEVNPGPEVPYVLPRVLEYPGMVAVISEIEMKNGYTAYTIAYFSEKKPSASELAAGWARKTYNYTTDLGEPASVTDNELWDFDLKHWLNEGKIMSCLHNSDNTMTIFNQPKQFPYLDISGRKENIVVKEDRCWTQGLPDGTEINPYEWD